jgi:hypothetical protein
LGEGDQAVKGEIYQDILVNGEVAQVGVRECAARYEPIKAFLSQYRRPFTVLDLGANFGYFSFRIAQDFPEAVCVMVESPRGKKLAELCQANTDLSRLIVLDRRITRAELRELAACEHFDVVLALNFVHHFAAQWKSVSDSILALGGHVFCETPPPEDKGACGQGHLAEIEKFWGNKGKFLGEFERHTSDEKSPMFFVENWEGQLTKPYWLAAGTTKQTFRDGIGIESHLDFVAGKHYFKKRTFGWQEGINLRTWQKLGGSWPSREWIIKQIRDRNIKGLTKQPHGDLMVWNMLLDGDSLRLIDAKPWMKKRDNERALKRVEAELIG